MASKAMFGAGCFWGVEESFAGLKGVLSTAVGYSGGHLQNPTYRQVCTDKTGHAEVVLLEYDEEAISYESLLDHFWGIHDPTTLNRQGPDRGSQYRSAIFYFTEAQRASAELSRVARQRKLNSPIVTQIAPAGTFWRAEEYHQQYFQKNPGAGCHI
jgi:peptide-methionine (S)-S-oxide reductase